MVVLLLLVLMKVLLQLVLCLLLLLLELLLLKLLILFVLGENVRIKVWIRTGGKVVTQLRNDQLHLARLKM